MTFGKWFLENWYSILEAAGIIGGLAFTAISFRADAKARRLENLLAITEQQRGIWQELYERPELSRVLQVNPDLRAKPITEAEELFVNQLFLHLNSAFQAIRVGLFSTPEGLETDIREFFSFPIPRMVWQKMRKFQNKALVKFVEANWSE